MSGGWESAFVAVGAILGQPIEASIAALGPSGEARAADLLQRLRAPSRDARARAIARVISEVVLALDAMSYA